MMDLIALQEHPIHILDLFNAMATVTEKYTETLKYRINMI